MTDAHLRLAILDPATHVALWAFNKHMNQARTQAARDKNFDEAMAAIVAGVNSWLPDPRGGNSGYLKQRSVKSEVTGEWT